MADELIAALRKLPEHWSLTPIGTNKAPYRPYWQSEPKISTDSLIHFIDGEKRISQKSGKPYTHYDYGIGLRTGDYSNGLLAIDFDGLSSSLLWDKIKGNNPDIDTVSWTSGKKGRKQILVQLPDQYRDQLKGFTKISIKQIDGIKSNDGEQLEVRYNKMQSVLPPSYHPQTCQYHWLNSPFNTEVAIAPDWLINWLVDHLTKTEREKAKREHQRLINLAENRERFKDAGHDLDDLVLQALHTIDPDCDYDTWVKVGMALHHYDSCLEHEFDLWSSGGSKYKGSRETDLKWRSFGGSGVSIGTLFYIAKEYGFEFPKREFEKCIDPKEPNAEEYLRYSEWLAEQEAIAEYEDLLVFDDWLESQVGHYLTKLDKGFGYSLPKPIDEIIRDNLTNKDWDVNYPSESLPTFENWQKLGMDREIRIRYKEEALPKLHFEFVQKGWQDLIDKSRTGLGKSHKWGGTAARTESTGKYWYINPQHSNPTVEPVLELKNLEPRHGGDSDEENTTPPNCYRADLFKVAYEKKVNLYATGKNPICGNCSFAHSCSKTEGMFLHERHKALAYPKIRCDIKQLPRNDYDYSKDVLILDEFSAWYEATEIVEVKQKDFDRTINDFEQLHPELSDKIRPLLRQIRSIFDRDDLEHYGWSSDKVEKYLKPIMAYLDIDHKELENAIALYDQKILELFGKNENLEQVRRERNRAKGKERDFLNWMAKEIKHLDNWETSFMLDDLPSQWLYLLLKLVCSDQQTTLRLDRRKKTLANGNFYYEKFLVFTTKNNSYNRIWETAKQTVILDATPYLPLISKSLNKPLSHFAVIEQEAPPIKNLAIRLTDTKGTKSNQFSDTAIERCKALVNVLSNENEQTGIITHKSLKPNFEQLLLEGKISKIGHWYLDNRGTNDFIGFNKLIAIGTPNQNLAAVTDACKCLDLDFDEYYQHLKEAEIVQLVGRQRAGKNPLQKHEVYYINADDHSLTIAGLAKYGYTDINIINAATLTPLAGNAQQRRTFEAVAVGLALHHQGAKFTQENIAKWLGITTEALRKSVGLHFKKITKLIKTLVTKITPTFPIGDIYRECWGFLKQQLNTLISDSELALVLSAMGLDNESTEFTAQEMLGYLEAMNIPPNKALVALVRLITLNSVFGVSPPPLPINT